MAEASVSVENECTEPLVAALMWGIGHSVCALAKISAVSRKLVQPKRTIKQNVLRGKMSISTSG